ncbi:hypothetical protein Tco_1118327 [Tanacetum coccineum]
MGASFGLSSFCRDVRDGAERAVDDLSSILMFSLSSFQNRWTCELSGIESSRFKVIINFIDDLFSPPSSDVPTRVNLAVEVFWLDSHMLPLCKAAMEDCSNSLLRCNGSGCSIVKFSRWCDLDWRDMFFSNWMLGSYSFAFFPSQVYFRGCLFMLLGGGIGGFKISWSLTASPPNRSTI